VPTEGPLQGEKVEEKYVERRLCNKRGESAGYANAKVRGEKKKSDVDVSAKEEKMVAYKMAPGDGGGREHDTRLPKI